MLRVPRLPLLSKTPVPCTAGCGPHFPRVPGTRHSPFLSSSALWPGKTRGINYSRSLCFLLWCKSLRSRHRPLTTTGLCHTREYHPLFPPLHRPSATNSRHPVFTHGNLGHMFLDSFLLSIAPTVLLPLLLDTWIPVQLGAAPVSPVSQAPGTLSSFSLSPRVTGVFATVDLETR